MSKETPYEYYNGKLGVKIKFLITDGHKHSNSLRLISYRALNKRINSKTCPEKELRRASLGNKALILFTSLSQDWKDLITIKFGNPPEEIKKDWFSRHYYSDGKAADFYARYTYGEENKKLEPEFIELYTYNASVLNTVLAIKPKRKDLIKSTNTTQIDIWESLSNNVNAFREVPHNLPTNKDSLRRKVNQYIKEGYACLISGKHLVKNAVKVKTKEQLSLLEKLLRQHQNLNNEQITNLYNIVAGSMDDWKTIDAGTVANYRKKLDLYVYAGNQGATAFMHNKIMQVKREKPSLPMLYWTIDGNVTELLYQRKTKNKKGHSVTTYSNRLTTVMVLDPFNQYIIGYAIGQEETPELIKQALRNALNHTYELFGERYKPYQLQSDRYQIKNLTPTYQAVSKISIPAKAHNSKAKVIEPFFDKFNEKHFQAKLLPNWSGHNVTSKKENQPNADFLNKIRHQFPDQTGCRMQIISAIENDRAEKVKEYVANWGKVPADDRLTLNTASYLRWFGEHSPFTNKLQGQGITPTILGETRYYDTFDLNFRKHAHTDWLVRYDPSDLTKVLVTNAKSKEGRLQEEIGTLQFLLEDKYIQPMALYDRKAGDSEALNKIFAHNKLLEQHVIEKNIQTDEILQELYLKNPQLELLSKLMISDSNGQHKLQKQESVKVLLAAQNHKEKEKEYIDYEIINNPRYNY